MIDAVKTRIPSVIADAILSIVPLKVAVWNNILDRLEEKCEELSNSDEGSCLKENQFEEMNKFDWCNILYEMEESCPELLDIFLCVAVPPNVDNVTNWQSIMQRVCLCYSLAVQSRYQSFSLVQRVLTVLCVEGGVSKKINYL